MHLLAWITDDCPAGIVAAFVSEDSLGHRRPATRHFDNRDDAIGWVESEAAAIHALVRWVDACR